MRVPQIYNKTITNLFDHDRQMWILEKYKTEPHQFFYYIESVCNAWFSFEIIIRFTVSFFCACDALECVTNIFSVSTSSLFLSLLTQR
jgi:potassium voltage-gated channel Shaw-related subfamily C protein 1